MQEVTLKYCLQMIKCHQVTLVGKCPSSTWSVFMVSISTFWYGLCPLELPQGVRNIRQFLLTKSRNSVSECWKKRTERKNIREESRSHQKVFLFFLGHIGICIPRNQICDQYFSIPQPPLFLCKKPRPGLISPRIVDRISIHHGWMDSS